MPDRTVETSATPSVGNDEDAPNAESVPAHSSDHATPTVGFVDRLRRHKVAQWTLAYAAGAYTLLHAVEMIGGALGWPHLVVRLTTLVLLLGVPVVITLAWFHGHRARQRVGGVELAILTMLFAAAGGVLWFMGRPDGAMTESVHTETGEPSTEVAAKSGPSIAVLAFKDMSPDKDQEYLSDGIAEELLNLLAKVPELRVISRSSSFFYKGKDINLAQVAEELKVAHILEGSVRKSGDRVRITAQLIEARSDTHLWSKAYDRTLDDIFAIQDDIAAAVVTELKVTLLGEAPHVERIDPETYALFLQARHLAGQGTAEGFEQSIVLYEQVLAVAPNYAPAWYGLANSYAYQADLGLRPMDEARGLARRAINQTLTADPEYAMAYVSLGMQAMAWDGDLAAAARHLERALQLAPTDAVVIGYTGVLLRNLGRVDQAITVLEYEAVRDPLLGGLATLAYTYSAAGRWDDAIATQRLSLRHHPDAIGAQLILGEALLYKGEVEAALAAIQEEKLEELRLQGLVMAYHAMGKQEESDAVLDELIEKQDSYGIASVLAYRNETDRAFEWLDKAVENGDPSLTGVGVDPAFSSIHSDPRWLPFLASIGKSPEQLDAIEFTVTLPQ